MSRPGIYGMAIDGASGRELERIGAVFGVMRDGARLFGWLLPWGQMDETFRERIWLAIQDRYR